MIRNGTRYNQIAEYYQNLIESKQLRSGEKMPTEEQICALFQVSRITVRQAMSELVQAGYIERVQGKGSYVKTPKTNMQLNHLQGFSEEMRAIGKVATSRLIDTGIENCDLMVAEHLGIETGTQVIYIKRLRLADNEPVAVEYVYIPFYLCPELLQKDLNGSLYSLLGEYGLKVHRASQNISAGYSPRNICELLNIKQASPTLNIERVTYLENGIALEYVQSSYRGDRYTFHVEMSR